MAGCMGACCPSRDHWQHGYPADHEATDLIQALGPRCNQGPRSLTPDCPRSRFGRSEGASTNQARRHIWLTAYWAVEVLLVTSPFRIRLSGFVSLSKHESHAGKTWRGRLEPFVKAIRPFVKASLFVARLASHSLDTGGAISRPMPRKEIT